MHRKLRERHTAAIYPPTISLKAVDTVDDHISAKLSGALYGLRGFIQRVSTME